MAYTLHIPGEPSRALRWNVKHALSSYGKGVLVFRNGCDVLDGATFCALRDTRGAWIETDRPDRARAALGLRSDESLEAFPDAGRP